MIKPIETVYNGYRFRSRLEARWAVFFDAAGIKYQYEPEGFEYEGERYLPDFYLPKEDVYVEVKPDDDKRISEIRKAVNVCCKVTGRMLIVLSDIPNIQNCAYWVFNAFYYHPAEQMINWRPVMIRPNVEEKTAWICSDFYIFRVAEKNEYQFFELKDKRLDFFPLGGVSCYTYELGSETTASTYIATKAEEYIFRACDLESREEYEYLKNAYEKARQARFEFGETPEVAR